MIRAYQQAVIERAEQIEALVSGLSFSNFVHRNNC